MCFMDPKINNFTPGARRCKIAVFENDSLILCAVSCVCYRRQKGVKYSTQRYFIGKFTLSGTLACPRGFSKVFRFEHGEACESRKRHLTEPHWSRVQNILFANPILRGANRGDCVQFLVLVFFSSCADAVIARRTSPDILTSPRGRDWYSSKER